MRLEHHLVSGYVRYISPYIIIIIIIITRLHTRVHNYIALCSILPHLPAVMFLLYEKKAK